MNCRVRGLKISEEDLLFLVGSSGVTKFGGAPAGVAGIVVCGEGVGIAGVGLGPREIVSLEVSPELK